MTNMRYGRGLWGLKENKKGAAPTVAASNMQYNMYHQQCEIQYRTLRDNMQYNTTLSGTNRNTILHSQG